MKSENGFSLLEVSVAVTIMAILTGLGLVISSNINDGNGTTVNNYELSGQDSLDLAECEAATVSDNSLSCDGGSGGGGQGSSGIIAIWDGVNITYSIDTNVCIQTDPMVSFYYLSTNGGSRLMSTTDDGSFAPATAGYPLGGNLGFGNTIQSYYITVVCSGDQIQSDNYVS